MYWGSSTVWRKYEHNLFAKEAESGAILHPLFISLLVNCSVNFPYPLGNEITIDNDAECVHTFSRDANHPQLFFLLLVFCMSWSVFKINYKKPDLCGARWKIPSPAHFRIRNVLDGFGCGFSWIHVIRVARGSYYKGIEIKILNLYLVPKCV